MHPYLIQAVSAERVADWQRAAAAGRQGRHARLTARRSRDRRPGPQPAGQPGLAHQACTERYRRYWEVSFDRLDTYLRRPGAAGQAVTWNRT